MKPLSNLVGKVKNLRPFSIVRKAISGSARRQNENVKGEQTIRGVVYWLADISMAVLSDEPYQKAFHGNLAMTLPPAKKDKNKIKAWEIRHDLVSIMDELRGGNETPIDERRIKLFFDKFELGDEDALRFSGELQIVHDLTFTLISQESLQLQLNRQPKRNCGICNENLPIGDFPPTVTNRCTHTSAFCISCVQNWIAAQVDDGTYNEIYCPSEICGQRLRYRDIKRRATRDMYRRYDRFVTRAKLNALPNFRWCLSLGCESGQEHDLAKNGPMFKCNKCKVRWCITHNTLWHINKTCAEIDRDIGRAEEDKASKELLEQISQRCPKCNIPIQRAGGCPHMTCRKCKHEFCWFCLTAWKVRNERGFIEHANTCNRARNDILADIPMEYQEEFVEWGHF